jgi:hypothetical protein
MKKGGGQPPFDALARTLVSYRGITLNNYRTASISPSVY